MERETTIERGAKFGLVFNGGGVKGAAFAGALLELTNRVDVRFEQFAGTSAGAMTAIVLAMGYDAKTTAAIINAQRFSDFLVESWEPEWSQPPWRESERPRPPRWRLVLRAIAYLFFELVIWFRILVPLFRGFAFSTKPIGRFIEHALRWRPHSNGRERIEPDDYLGAKFRSLKHGALVVASSTGTPNTVLFGSPEDDVEHAVRCSVAIPGFFEPQVVGKNILFDGGLVANFALDQARREWAHANVLGLYLHDASKPDRPSDATLSATTVLKHVFRIFLGQDENLAIEANRHCIVRINTAPIGTVDFSIGQLDKELMAESGRLAVLRFLHLEPHGLPLLKDKEPTAAEYAEAVNRVNALREAAVARWKWPHRFRLIRILIAASLTILVPFLIVFAAGVAAARSDQPAKNDGAKIVDVAVVLNGDAEYARTIEDAFKSRLRELLAPTGLAPRFERTIGSPGSSDRDFAANQGAVRELLERFERPPALLFTIGTQVSVDALRLHRDKLPIVFAGVTDPVASGLVSSMDGDKRRGNIAGVSYATPENALRFLSTTFPDARLGYLYDAQIAQDVIVRDRIAKFSHESGIAVTPIEHAQAVPREIDVVFGWYYVNANFAQLSRTLAVALVAGNEADMTRGAVALVANNDIDSGRRAAEQIVVPWLMGKKALYEIPILRCDSPLRGVNIKAAQRYGLRVAQDLPPEILRFEQ
ncbi:MAG: ABC transporter substrate binding protein [Archangium sp.]